MGSRERHDRERQAVREAILTAARELFVHEGYRNVSMRKIAERIEYSPAAIYGYFESKDAIFFALAEEGFRLMGDAHDAATGGAADALDALRRMFLGYYGFSREHPQFFALMFLDRSVPQLSERWDELPFAREKMLRAIAVVERAVSAGALPPGTDAAAAFHVLWAAIHGPAALAVCGRLSPDEDPEALAADALDAVIAGLRAGVRPRFQPAVCRQDSPVSHSEDMHHVTSS
jgi:AcrR family transcriptional regulator